MKASSVSPLHQAFARAMDGIAARVAPADWSSLAIAFSGGLDSSVLLHLARAHAAERGIALRAFHVHHGLSPNADAWLEHCRCVCVALGIEFDARHVTLSEAGNGGIEEAARIARYAALGEMAASHRMPLLLTAHHLDDQAETVLLQLLRGAGVAGMSGMEIANRAPSMLGSAAVTLGRPLLATSRADLEYFAREQNIAYVQDESNGDLRYARNALRRQVMPVLAACFPGFQTRFARTAHHAQEGQRLLVDLAAQDYAACCAGDALDVKRLRQLDTGRADNLLRYWFGLHGLRMPSTAWLNEMRTQLLEAKGDAQLCVTHADCHIRRHRDRAFIMPRLSGAADEIEPAAFAWNGEASLYFPAFGGTLHFDPAQAGIDSGWLRGRPCEIHCRQGGERLKLAPNRPARSLKSHYQALDIPAWERARLPLASSGGRLLFAAGIGMDCAQVGAGGAARIRFRWQTDSAESGR